jgi:hypothetical protein
MILGGINHTAPDGLAPPPQRFRAVHPALDYGARIASLGLAPRPHGFKAQHPALDYEAM